MSLQKVDSLNAILARATPFLMEKPNKNFVRIQSVISGAKATLLWDDKHQATTLGWDTNNNRLLLDFDDVRWVELFHGEET